jgi:transcriptional regulator with AAA-type ATPase domain
MSPAAQARRRPTASFVSDREREVLRAFASLALGVNPFLTERVGAEARALGPEFVQTSEVWHVDAKLVSSDPAIPGLNPNVPRLGALAERFTRDLRERLVAGARPRRDELLEYEGLVRYLLYWRYENEWLRLLLRAALGQSTTVRMAAWPRFAADVSSLLEIPGVDMPTEVSAGHLFAWGFQIRRAFEHTFRQIFGGSMPAAELRARVWQSVFTHDSARYRRSMYRRMGDIPTLIIGESGTGKELVARAIALSRYVPFDEEAGAFAEEYAAGFHALNLSSLSPTLVESELFGHRRGSFTGALQDRAGWLESCGPHGSVFLDEIGELDGTIQVKLLRVLQTRSFQRIGETGERLFRGKIIAATNRDLAEEMDAGRFRADLYYRLCADVIETPTLRAQLTDAPGELRNLVLVLARRIAGTDEAEALTEEVVTWVTQELGADYPWPGNVRELEQCVRNVLVHGRYLPPRGPRTKDEDLATLLHEGRLSAEDLLRRYCTETYARTGSYEEAARRLGLDRRTVKAKVDRELLERLRGRGES